MDAELLAAVAAGSAWAGFLLGRRWADVRVRLAKWGVIDSGRALRAVRVYSLTDGPAPVIDTRPAWDAHLLYMAYQCAPLERISEASVSDAGIVTRTDYRIMAPYLRRCGLWVRLPTRTGRPGKNRWAEWPPHAAIGRVRDAMRAGRLNKALPYPPGRPPAIMPRK